jgi:hypothetical protein
MAIKSLGLVLLGLTAAACTSDADLRPFTSDGCSLFPDTSIINEDDWCSCCFDHDLAYWRGGTAEQREQADSQLQECVLAKTDDKILASAMYEGVRLGGSPYFYNWYRWGYGWGFDRKYLALTAQEGEVADRLLQQYFSSTEQNVCAN